MEKKIFFQSSLPRSGSTLFQNVVAQNPDFYSTPTSGLLELAMGAKGNFQQSPEFKAQDAKLMDKAFLAFCKGGINAYFNALTDKPFVLDKNRGWGVSYKLAEMIFETQPKIVFMVRDLRAVYASMEKNYRKNPHKENHIVNPVQLQGTTVNKRIDIWANGVPVGISLDRLRDIIQQGLDKKILFIRYEDFMSNPQIEMKRFYDYIGQPYYDKHDFENIIQYTQENDAIHGIYGDHTLRPKFERLPDDFYEVLGYELCQNIKNSYEWFFKYFTYI
jgi:sulfotransferase